MTSTMNLFQSMEEENKHLRDLNEKLIYGLQTIAHSDHGIAKEQAADILKKCNIKLEDPWVKHNYFPKSGKLGNLPLWMDPVPMGDYTNARNMRDVELSDKLEVDQPIMFYDEDGNVYEGTVASMYDNVSSGLIVAVGEKTKVHIGFEWVLGYKNKV